MFFTTDAQPCLRNEIAEWERRRQMLRLAEQMRLDFLLHDIQCSMVQR